MKSRAPAGQRCENEEERRRQAKAGLEQDTCGSRGSATSKAVSAARGSGGPSPGGDGGQYRVPVARTSREA